MFTELNIIYPNNNCNEKILNLLCMEKEKFMQFEDCIDYLIYEDTYSDKIVYIIQWQSKESMRKVNNDNDSKTNLKDNLLKLQKFPSEVYYLNEITKN